MNSKVYRQIDDKFKSMPYPTKSSNFGDNGCGCCAITHVLIEVPNYWCYTPKDVQPYMKQFAVVGQGTTWGGIKTALEHYGMKNVKWFDRNDPMSSVFKECDKGSRKGVLLMTNGATPDKTLWTSSGHYVAFVDYKVENGKHYFYTKDSGFRKHDGWFCYETSMKNAVSQVWTCTLGLSKSEKISKRALEYSYFKGTSKSKYAWDGGKPCDKYKKAFNKYLPDKKDISGCNQFVHVVLKSLGYKMDSSNWTKITKYLDDQFEKKNKISEGCIVVCDNDKGGHHILIVVKIGGKLMIAEAQQKKTWSHINTSTKKLDNYKKIHIYKVD